MAQTCQPLARRATGRRPARVADPGRQCAPQGHCRRLGRVVACRCLVLASARPQRATPGPAGIAAGSRTTDSAAPAGRRAGQHLGLLLERPGPAAAPWPLAPEPAPGGGDPAGGRCPVAATGAPDGAGTGADRFAPGANRQLAHRRGDRPGTGTAQPAGGSRHAPVHPGRDHPAQPRRSARQGSGGG
ncbi:hypothetical protein D3C80_1534460 [compost metagenome]